MADEIINRVAKSNLVSIDLETFYTTEKRSLIDIKYWLFQELVLKEKEFRETLKKFDWQQYKNHHIALHCSSDAIVPTWAYMLIQTHLSGIAKTVIVGSMEQLESIIYAAIINNLDLDYCTDKHNSQCKRTITLKMIFANTGSMNLVLFTKSLSQLLRV